MCREIIPPVPHTLLPQAVITNLTHKFHTLDRGGVGGKTLTFGPVEIHNYGGEILAVYCFHTYVERH